MIQNHQALITIVHDTELCYGSGSEVCTAYSMSPTLLNFRYLI